MNALTSRIEGMAATGGVMQVGGVLQVDLPAAASAHGPTAVKYTLQQVPSAATRAADEERARSCDQTVSFSVEWSTDAAMPRRIRVGMLQGLLTVVAFEPKPWGFTVRFDGPLKPALPAPHATQAVRVLVTGEGGGPVRGSLVEDRDGKGFAFILGGATLLPGTYLVSVHVWTSGLADAAPLQAACQATESAVSSLPHDDMPRLRLPAAASLPLPVSRAGRDDAITSTPRPDGRPRSPGSPLVDLSGSFANFALQGDGSAAASDEENLNP